MRNRTKYFIIIIVALIVFFLINYFLNVKKQSGIFEIVEKTNGGVPYVWKYEIKNKDIVEYVETIDVNKAGKNTVGGPVEQHFKFKALKKGNTIIRFRYLSVVNSSVDQDKTYNIYVDNNLNVKIK